MRNRIRQAHRWALFLLLCPSFALAQSPGVTATATADKKTISLSQSLRATLTVEGPAPLRVELGKSVLAPETDRDWKIQPIGKPVVSKTGTEREKWVQVYRLDPYVAGETMMVAFAPLQVNGRETPGPGFEIRVLSPKLEAKDDAARSVTPIEQLPAPPVPPPSSLVWWWMLNALLIVFVLLLAWRLRRRPKPVPPAAWASRAFDRLEYSASGADQVEGIATVVRGFIERRFGIPAPKLTTQELLAMAQQSGWPVEQTDPLRLLLDDCDRAKFAGDIPDDDGCRRLLARGRGWVNLVSPDTGPT